MDMSAIPIRIHDPVLSTGGMVTQPLLARVAHAR